MLIDMPPTFFAESISVEDVAVFAPVPPDTKRYTLLAVYEGAQWASLCRELDIASSGQTANDAFDTLEKAVNEALAFEQEERVSAGERVPDAELERFLRSGDRGSRAAARFILR